MTKVGVRHYILVTLAYWLFMLTDGALRMLVLLHFHDRGFTAFDLALLFLLYEFFGVITNFTGGWLASLMGLRATLVGGLVLQVLALWLLTIPAMGSTAGWLLWYVMAVQALSGIAKDLTKMSSKSAIKFVVREEGDGTLFKWMSVLTGSKNAIKGAGFFAGGLLLAFLGFELALRSMAILLFVVLLLVPALLPRDMGRASRKKKFTELFSKSRDINLLSAARLFLFGSRDVWFVVAVPVFLSASLGWSHPQIGTFLAVWVIAYGVVQSITPALIRRRGIPGGRSAFVAVSALAVTVVLVMAGIAWGGHPGFMLIAGLALYGFVFAINSAIHSYLVLAYSQHEDVTVNVGFYYMANAAGRLVGTLLSGLSYQLGGLQAALATSLVFVGIAALLSQRLDHRESPGSRRP